MNSVVKILLVEDDALDQMDVMRTLERKGILSRMKIARNGEEALNILNDTENDAFAGKPDVILMDLNMPKMNGLELLNQLKKNPEWRDIKVFVLASSDEKEDRAAVLDFGVSGFITKPLKLESPSSMDAFNLMIDLMYGR